MAVLAGAYGWLLVFRPDMFLQFYDRINPGDNKNMEWRQHIRDREARLLGWIFMAVCVWLVQDMVRAFWR